MDRGHWWSTVHEITESDTTERLTLSLQDSRGCCERFKREGALQVLKAISAEELIFLSLGRERSEREDAWHSWNLEDKKYPRAKSGCT